MKQSEVPAEVIGAWCYLTHTLLFASTLLCLQPIGFSSGHHVTTWVRPLAIKSYVHGALLCMGEMMPALPTSSLVLPHEPCKACLPVGVWLSLQSRQAMACALLVFSLLILLG